MILFKIVTRGNSVWNFDKIISSIFDLELLQLFDFSDKLTRLQERNKLLLNAAICIWRNFCRSFKYEIFRLINIKNFHPKDEIHLNWKKEICVNLIYSSFCNTFPQKSLGKPNNAPPASPYTKRMLFNSPCNVF